MSQEYPNEAEARTDEEYLGDEGEDTAAPDASADAGDADTTAEAAEAAAEQAEADSEEVTDLPEQVEAQIGDMPDDELEALRPVCTRAEETHEKVLALIKEIKSAENVLQRFQSRQGDLTPLDVDAAKKRFYKAKQSYLQLGNQINDGIKQVYTAAKSYPDDLLVQNLYKAYLAKLLSSLETRNPPEPLVQALAAAQFDFERHEVTLDEKEEQFGLTVEQKRKRLLEETARYVNMLETRYRKRQLANRLRSGERPGRILRRLVRLLDADPEDLHTYIWVAKLMAEQMAVERNQNTRVTMRDEILGYCKKAFSMIDDFLNLQGINTISERDKRRAGYVKTITAIRRPLVKGSK